MLAGVEAVTIAEEGAGAKFERVCARARKHWITGGRGGDWRDQIGRLMFVTDPLNHGK
jgi:hypothetical protein